MRWTRLKSKGMALAPVDCPRLRCWLGLRWRRIRISYIVLGARLRGLFWALRLGRKPTLAAIQRALIAHNQSIEESLLEWAATCHYSDLPEKERLRRLEELRSFMEDADFIPTELRHELTKTNSAPRLRPKV